MSILLYTLLFLFLYFVCRAALKVYSIYRRLHDVTKQFRDFNAGQNAGGYGNGTYNNTTYGSNAGTTGNSSSSYRRTSTTTPTGEVVEDRRTEDEINRKIFTREEGEYIDFEEVK